MAANSIQKTLSKDEEEIEAAGKTKNFWLLSHAITNKDNHQTILKSIDFLSLFASAALFISIGSIINLEKLWFYRYEIISIFIISTIVRGLTMFKFAWVSNNISVMANVKTHWLGVLTFAGSKGAISILMVHLLPDTFIHKELFENIIIGNIILSTFIYAIALTYIFKKHADLFEKELQTEEMQEKK